MNPSINKIDNCCWMEGTIDVETFNIYGEGWISVAKVCLRYNRRFKIHDKSD